MEPAKRPRVLLEGQGVLEGTANHDVARFLSVPYAAPPLGPLRWSPPQHPDGWSGVRSDPKHLPRCPQMGPLMRTFKGHAEENTEDCLVLNVWTPLAAIQHHAGIEADSEKKRGSFRSNGRACSGVAVDRKSQRDMKVVQGAHEHLDSEAGACEEPLLPVLVYIHGGGGKAGSAHLAGSSGLELAKVHSLCCFHINYRHGIFGFLAHPDLSAEDERRVAEQEQAGGCPACVGSGNYALLDQVAALRWVRRHARKFGGDPGNVTIWGLSSGAQYVSTLLISPLAAGLFHRAVVQSCADLNTIRKLRSSSDIWLGKSAEEWGVKLGAKMRCPKGAGQIDAMRRLPAATVARYCTDKAANDCYEPAIDDRWGKRCDDWLQNPAAKPHSSIEALRAGHYHRVPVLLGVTEHDGLGKEELEQTLFEAIQDRSGLLALLEREFGPDGAKKALALYERGLSKQVTSVEGEAAWVGRFLGEFSNDLWYFAGTQHMADLLAASGTPAFLYRFAALKRRSLHGYDSTFWRGSADCPVASLMATYLANFARCGDPNGPDLPRWDAHMQGSGRSMVLSTTSTMESVDDYERERIAFITRDYFSKRLVSELQRGAEPGDAKACEKKAKRPRRSPLES